jgi:hypothetical protein
MRRPLLWIQLVLAALIVVGVWLQVYFIASYFFGAEDALDAHEATGGITHLVELLVFLAALGAWWRNWGRIGFALLFPVVGTVQIAFSESDAWTGGLHGLLALVILVLAVYQAKWNAEELGLRGGPRADAAPSAPPPPRP